MPEIISAHHHHKGNVLKSLYGQYRQLDRVLKIAFVTYVLIVISTPFIVLNYQIYKSQAQKELTPIREPIGTTPDSIEFSGNEILVKVKRQVKGIVSENKDNTGIQSLNEKLSKHKAKKFERIVKETKNSKPDENIFRWYKVELDKPQKILKAKQTPENQLQGEDIESQDLLTIIDEFREDPNIEYAEPNFIVRAIQNPSPTAAPLSPSIAPSNVYPNDPYYPQMWNLQRIQMENAWGITKGSNSVTVAVIDTGVDYTHPDLGGCLGTGCRVIGGYDFVNNDSDPIDDEGHGTHVAGTIGALVNNSIGVSGINWDVKLMAVKVLDLYGYGNTDNIAKGIIYSADNEAKVINISLGARVRCAQFQAVQDAISYSYSKKVVVVVAAGNGNDDASNFSPPSCNNVIAVASTGPTDERAYYSNYGVTVDLAAPGGDKLKCLDDSCLVNSTYPGNQYKFFQGTSMAAPHVAGVVALMHAKDMTLTPDQIEIDLRDRGDVIFSDKAIGKRLNACKTLGDENYCPPNPTPTPIPTPIPFAMNSFGKTAVFDGKTSYISIPGFNTNLQSDFTIEVWFKGPKRLTTSLLPIIDKVNPIGNPTPLFLGIGNTKFDSNLLQHYFAGVSEQDNNSSSCLFGAEGGKFIDFYKQVDEETISAWQHIAIVISKEGVLDLFIDGHKVEQESAVKVARPCKNDLPLTIGALMNVNKNPEAFFEGLIDEVRISNIARYSSNFIPIAEPFIPDTNTMALYHFDGEAQDATGNGNDGQIFGDLHFVGELPRPDLLPTSLSTTTFVQYPGGNIKVPHSIKNQGTATASAIVTEFHLSKDQVYGGADDIVFTNKRNISSLAPGQTSSTTAWTISIPSSTPLGNYYICAMADSINTNTESSETNNTLCTTSTIKVALPDLVVTSHGSVTSAYTGTNISIPITISNKGEGPSKSIDIGIYLSKDNIITTSDTRISTLTLSSGLSPNATKSSNPSGNLASTLTPGVYYLGAIADYNQKVKETNEWNNTLLGNQITILPGADLVVTSVTGPSEAIIGTSIGITTTTKNQGLGSVSYSTTGIYLSTDQSITTSDIRIGTISVGSLAINQLRTATATLTLPSTLTPGEYYLGAIADYDNKRYESDENNNGLVGNGITVQ